MYWSLKTEFFFLLQVAWRQSICQLVVKKTPSSIDFFRDTLWEETCAYFISSSTTGTGTKCSCKSSYSMTHDNWTENKFWHHARNKWRKLIVIKNIMKYLRDGRGATAKEWKEKHHLLPLLVHLPNRLLPLPPAVQHFIPFPSRPPTPCSTQVRRYWEQPIAPN